MTVAPSRTSPAMASFVSRQAVEVERTSPARRMIGTKYSSRIATASPRWSASLWLSTSSSMRLPVTISRTASMHRLPTQWPAS